MKTKLLSLIITTVLLTSAMNAQTKVWDFGNNATTWPITPTTVPTGTIGAGTTAVIDNLGLYSSDPTNTTITNFGAVTASSSGAYTDGYVGANRFQLNGMGYTTATGFLFMPTQRYLFFDVSGACTVKVWFKSGSNGAARTIFVTNGTATVGSATTNSGGNTDIAILTASATVAGRYYIFGDSAINLYKITVTGATVNTVLATQTFSQSILNVVAANKQVNISNVTSSTEVNVYSMTGALVKTLKIDADTTFDLPNSGLYVVNVKSAEGEKSVKVAIK